MLSFLTVKTLCHTGKGFPGDAVFPLVPNDSDTLWPQADPKTASFSRQAAEKALLVGISVQPRGLSLGLHPDIPSGHSPYRTWAEAKFFLVLAFALGLQH